MAEQQTHIVTVKCTSHAFDSKNALQYFPGREYQIDLADRDQRKLVWLKTLGGKWVFQFDRANTKIPTALHLFLCKVCGQPFDRLQELGNHTNSVHPPKKKDMDETLSIEGAEEEERLLAERRAAEEAEQVEVVK